MTQGKIDDEYNDFTFAIIWGTFETLDYRYFLTGFSAHNSDPNNQTISVIGYVNYEHKFVFRKAAWIDCPWWIGFAGQHRLFIIGWGWVKAWP